MATKTQEDPNAARKDFVSQSGYGLKKETSQRRGSEQRNSDMAAVWKDKYLHLLADLENTKKRLARASAREIEVEHILLLKDMLQVADAVDLILDHVSDEEDSRNIFQGIKALKNILDTVFITHDVKPIDAQGMVFDPYIHEALGMVRDRAATGHTVVRVEKKGYLYGGKLLRPAQVMVESD